MRYSARPRGPECHLCPKPLLLPSKSPRTSGPAHEVVGEKARLFCRLQTFENSILIRIHIQNLRFLHPMFSLIASLARTGVRYPSPLSLKHVSASDACIRFFESIALIFPKDWPNPKGHSYYRYILLGQFPYAFRRRITSTAVRTMICRSRSCRIILQAAGPSVRRALLPLAWQAGRRRFGSDRGRRQRWKLETLQGLSTFGAGHGT